MEQKDYIMREVEKINAVLNAIRVLIFGGEGNIGMTLESQNKRTKDILMNEIGFDFDAFLNMNTEESNLYMLNFIGFNNSNLEQFAYYLLQIGLDFESYNSEKYLNRALQLFEFCKTKDKTFSFEREDNIKLIQKRIQLYHQQVNYQ